MPITPDTYVQYNMSERRLARSRCRKNRWPHGQGRRTVGGVDDTPLWRRHATQQPIHQTTHTANTAKHTKGAKRTMSAYTPCALRFYTSSTARGRYTHSRQRGDTTLTRGRERRERSSASALQQTYKLQYLRIRYRDSRSGSPELY